MTATGSRDCFTITRQALQRALVEAVARAPRLAQFDDALAKAGLYRFHARVADMRGMPEVKTIGPDNKLVLTVRVS